MLNLGIAIAGNNLLGTALPPILITAISTHYDWRQAFIWMFVPNVIIAILVIFF